VSINNIWHMIFGAYAEPISTNVRIFAKCIDVHLYMC
jgi:hypothetical protein